jgi:hypothetical protein
LVSLSALVCRSCADTPKSASLAKPWLSSRMLPAFMSRWIFLFACRYSIPFRA